MMSGDMLSQDEIDALLRGGDDEDTEEIMDDSFNVEDYLSSMEEDALGEIGNISFGSSATALSTLLNHKVDITTPTVNDISQKNYKRNSRIHMLLFKLVIQKDFMGVIYWSLNKRTQRLSLI